MEPIKNLGGPGQDLGGGPVPPWPQPKTATGHTIKIAQKD